MSLVVSLVSVGVCLVAAGLVARVAAGGRAWSVVLARVRRHALAALSYKARLVVMAVTVIVGVAVAVFLGREVLVPILGPSFEEGARAFLLDAFVGVVAWPAVWAGFASSASTIRSEQMLGTLEVVVAMPTGLPAVPLAALVRQWVVTIPAMGGLFLVAGWIAPIPGIRFENLPVVLAALILGGLFLWGVGLAFGSLMIVYKRLGGVQGFIQIVLIALSGAYFPVDSLPAWAASVAELFPLTYAFELVREALFAPVSAGFVLPRLGLLAGAALVTATLGTWGFARGLDFARSTGRLRGY